MFSKRFCAQALALSTILGLGAAAHAVVITGSGTVGTNAISAEADVTFGAGTITITLKNLTTDPNTHDAGEALTGFDFTLSSGSITGITSSSGQQVDVDGSGHVTVAASGEPTVPEWGTQSLGAGFRLAFNLESGGIPPAADSSILGPDATDAVPGTYSVGSSLSGNGHQPYTYKNGTFVIAAPGVNGDTKITESTFRFGTQLETGIPGDGGGSGRTPEPASVGILAIGGLALLARRRKA